ncbi:MAG: DNA repair protein RadA [Patescibacteria group bacterium]
MAKTVTIFSCTKCGAQFPKWQGRCTECGSWGTFSKGQPAVRQRNARPTAGRAAPVETLATIGPAQDERLESSVREFDRVLGGGIVAGSLALLGGDPGIGKSTLILQVGGKLASLGREVLYVSGEESSVQVKDRFTRLGLTTDKLKFLGETDIETVRATVEQHKPALVIIDSIQTVHTAEVDAEAGSISQLKACTAKLSEAARDLNTAMIVIGHVTKKGGVAGPRTLEHLVDVVLYLEGDRHHAFRVLRAVKNRFGSTAEVGVFDMQAGGLAEVRNPSEIFLADRTAESPGSVVTAVVEGSRAFLVEVQALVSRANFGYPQRRAAGFDFNRLQMLVAVLTKKAGLYLGNQDVHVNVAGGFRVGEPAADLAVCLAIASALKNKPIPKTLAVFGEVGLGGELRAVGQSDKRLDEIVKMGFKEALIPRTKLSQEPGGLQIVMLDSLSEVIRDFV